MSAPSGSALGFTGGADAWLAGLGGLRNTVRQELVTRQLDEQIAAHFAASRRLRVLDVGLGQGTQALRLARAGHEVTGLESDAAMLDAARNALAAEPEPVRERVRLVGGDGHEAGHLFGPGGFDLVLCHGVLMYVPEPGPFIGGLAEVLAPGGLLSLLVRNGDALAMRPGLAGEWAQTLAAFDTAAYTNRLGLPVRADRRDELTATPRAVGVQVHAWYGVRVFTDTASSDATPPIGREELELLLAAEDRAGRTDPYRGVAALLHLCAVRDRGTRLRT